MTSLTDESREAAFAAVLRSVKHVVDEDAKEGWVSRVMDAIGGTTPEQKLRGTDFVTRLEAATIVAASIEYLAGTIQMCFGSQVSDSDQDEKPISAKLQPKPEQTEVPLMGEPFTADTQYDDLTGWAAFDGHSGQPLPKLAEHSTMPDGYIPVGFELFQLDRDEDGTIPFTVIAVRKDEVGSWDEIIKFAEAGREIPAYRFDGTIEPKEFFSLFFKRIDIKAVKRELAEAKIVVSQPPEDALTGR